MVWVVDEEGSGVDPIMWNCRHAEASLVSLGEGLVSSSDLFRSDLFEVGCEELAPQQYTIAGGEVKDIFDACRSVI